MEPVGSPAVARVRVYEPGDVERFFEEAVEERLQRREALDRALARARAAREQLRAVSADRGRLASLVLDAEEREARLDADAARAVREIIAAADAEAEACIATARAEVAHARLAVAVRQLSGEPPRLPAPSVVDLTDHRVAEAV